MPMAMPERQQLAHGMSTPVSDTQVPLIPDHKPRAASSLRGGPDSPAFRTMTTTNAGLLCASDVRASRQRLLKMHYESGVGHIGGDLSSLDAMMVVFHEYLREEDKFVLSKGHSAGALLQLYTKGALV